MLEWDIVEEEEGPPADRGESPFPIRRPWYQWVLVGGVLLALVGGAIWATWQWQARQLRRDIEAAILQETRLMALGAGEQAAELADPGASSYWQFRYQQYLATPRPLAGPPTVTGIRLEEEGRLALVSVRWSGGAGEQRAYRLVQGRWRRTALPGDGADAQLVSHASEYFVLRAAPLDMAVLTTPLALPERWESLRAHVAQTWQGWEVESYPITVIFQRLEFAPIISPTSSRRTLRANSPRLSYVMSNLPLSSEAHYELHLTSTLLRRVLPYPRGEGDHSAFLLYRQLLDAEARHAVLDAAERRALRNEWRRTLQGDWPSPLEAPPSLTEQSSEAERAAFERWWLASALLLDHLVEQEGRALPGVLASALHAEGLRLDRPQALLRLYSQASQMEPDVLFDLIETRALLVEE